MGYPIPQYRTENWQIPKYRGEHGRNTDTAFMFFFISSMYTPHINLSLREKTCEDLELIGTAIEKPAHWISYHIIE